MASKTETGHAVNIANFKKIIDECTGYGAPYNPGNADLALGSLTAKWTAADTAQTNLNTILSSSKVPINQRRLAFEPLDKLVTRSYNYLKSTKADKELKKDVKGLADKIRGTKVKHPAPVPPDDAANPDPDWVSNSHLSYVQKVNNFRSFIDLLLTTGEYNPNEATLTTASLNTLWTSLKSMNDNFQAAAVTPVEIARSSRNHLLYDHETGVVDISLQVKDYVRSVYGVKAEETKRITKITLVRPKKK